MVFGKIKINKKVNKAKTNVKMCKLDVQSCSAVHFTTLEIRVEQMILLGNFLASL